MAVWGRGLHNWIRSARASGAAAVFALLLVPAMVFAQTQCCMYATKTDGSTPQWVQQLGDTATLLKAPLADGSCPAPDQVVLLSKTSQYYGAPIPMDTVCTDPSAGEFQQVSKALNAVKCCIRKDANDNPLSCYPKDSGSKYDSCLSLAYNDMTGSDKIYQSSQSCAALTECAQAQLNSAISAAAPGISPLAPTSTSANTSKPQWTKDECLSFKDQHGQPSNFWQPPANNPTLETGDYCFVKQRTVDLEINIGNYNQINGIQRYIPIVFKYVMGFGILLVVIMLMGAGLVWMTSGTVGSIEAAKKRIEQSVLGLLLLLASYVILYTVNPDLVSLKLPPMHAIRPEKFAVEQNVKECDPGNKTSCNKYGAGYHCEPSYDGLKKYCGEATMKFLGVVAAPAAIGLGGAFALEAYGVTGGASQTVWQTVKSLASSAVKSAPKELIKGTVLEEAGKKVGDAIAPAILVAGGVLAADSLLAEKPPLGLCVISQHDKQDGQLCTGDADCVAGSNCLITKSTCSSINTYGVCTSGKLYEPCISGGALTDNDAKKKFGCQAGASCVDNGYGAGKWFSTKIGFCSDGSKLGMACNADVPCKSDGKIQAECIQGYCREKGYFDPDTGDVIKWDVNHPKCVLPSECFPHGAQTQAGVQYACLKGASEEYGLPARALLGTTTATAVDYTYYRELGTAGVCTRFANSESAEKKALCYVTVQPAGETQTKGIVLLNLLKQLYKSNDFANNGFYKDAIGGVEDLPAQWQKGISVKYVGCGATENLACEIPAYQLWLKGLKVPESGVVSFLGDCTKYSFTANSGEIKVGIDPTKGSETLVSGTNSGNNIAIPLFTDLDNIFGQ